MLEETGAPGWVGVSAPDLGARVLVKFGRRDGRWVVRTLVVHDDPVTAATLRAVPVARVETMLNEANIGGRCQTA